MLDHDIDAGLPRLAWCAHLARDGKASVRCGPWVERREDAFVEGAWSGDFGAFRFDEALTLAGSGGRAVADGWLFSCATNTMQPLFSLRQGPDLWFSNSLPFLLAEAGCTLDPAYPYYEVDMYTVMFGLDRLQRTLPTRQGPRIHIHRHVDVRVGHDLGIEERPKPRPAPFADFETYAGVLRSEVLAVAANAADERRRVRYPPLATISSGYDSLTGAVMLRDAGCREAITFSKARETFETREDSGRRAAEALGLAVQEVDPDAARDARPWRDEVRILAAACGTDDVIFVDFGDRLSGRLVTLGHHGGAVWGLGESRGDDPIRRRDASGCSLAELRLHSGTVFLVFPFIGCTRQDSITAISRSDAMAPWRVGGNYDRPIPRRIIESAGVPRGWFGQAKRAAGTPHLTADRTFTPIEQIFGPETVRRFYASLARRSAALMAWGRLRHALLGRLVASTKVRRLLALFVGAERVRIWHWRYVRPWAPQLFLTNWAVAEIMGDYARPARNLSGR